VGFAFVANVLMTIATFEIIWIGKILDICDEERRE
jgi:hypothetical protein